MRPERRSVPGLADEIPDLEASLSADRSPRNVMRVAEALWILERPERALELLRPLVRESPALISPRILLAWCAEDAGQPAEARAEREEVAALDPANPYARPEPTPAPDVEPEEAGPAEAAVDAEPTAPAELAVSPEPEAAAEPAPEPEPAAGTGPEEPWSDPELEAEPERALDAASLREVPPGPLYSATLAEIFAKQGFQEKAIEIYRRLESQDPGRADLRNRIRALEEQAGGTQP